MRQTQASRLSQKMLLEAYFQSAAWLYAYTEAKGIRSLKAHIIYCVIYSHCASSGAGNAAYYGTLETLQFWTRSSDRGTVINALKELEAAGMIQKTTCKYNGRTRPAYVANVREAENFRNELGRARLEDMEENPRECWKIRQLENSTVGKFNSEVLENPNPSVGKSNSAVLENPPLKKPLKRIEVNNRSVCVNAREDENEACMYSEREAADITEPGGDFIVPTLDEVRAAIDQLPVKPIEYEITACAEGFLGKMESEGWRVRNWRARLRSYAATWYANHSGSYARRRQAQQRQKPLYETPDSPRAPFNDDDIPF